MLNRREFAVSISSALFLRPQFLRGQGAQTLRVGVVLEPAGEASRDASNGVALALAETERAGALFKRQVAVIEKRPSPVRESLVGEMIRSQRLHVVIGGMSFADARELRDAAQRTGIVFLNIGAHDDSLRTEECRPAMYHVAASDAMLRSAESAAHSSGSASVELWHSSLERYGAAQLNDRFRARFNRPMTSAAWAGWFALKLAWEAWLRSDASTLAHTLESDSSQFDGHKGAPLSFRKWDHQLRQPLYVVAGTGIGGRVVAEMPDVGKDSEESMRDQLDRFGDRGTTARCVNR